MHSLFMVGAKLLGLYFIVNGLTEAALLANRGGAAPFANQIAASCFVKLMAGTVLAFFTGLVAKVLRFQEPPADETPRFADRSALEVGIILLALFEFLSLLPRVAARVSDYFQQGIYFGPGRLSDPLGLESVGLAATLACVFFAHRIAAFLERVNRHSSAP